jgi:hypothetical protein
VCAMNNIEEFEVQLHSFSISALEEGEWPASFTPQQPIFCYPLNMRLSRPVINLVTITTELSAAACLHYKN